MWYFKEIFCNSSENCVESFDCVLWYSNSTIKNFSASEKHYSSCNRCRFWTYNHPLYYDFYREKCRVNRPLEIAVVAGYYRRALFGGNYCRCLLTESFFDYFLKCVTLSETLTPKVNNIVFLRLSRFRNKRIHFIHGIHKHLKVTSGILFSKSQVFW